MDNQTHRSAPALAAADQPAGGPGVSHVDPDDPAAPYYALLARLRQPLTLRDIMIRPVRTGYIGQGHPTPPDALPPTAAALYPEVRVSEVAVAGPAGPIRCQVYAPGRATTGAPMLLYMHGGGFTVGSSEDTAYITSRIAREAGVLAVSVNYRLAPEWPFPAALDDCMAVLRWMRAQGAEVGGDPRRIAVAGDSAGGNFAAALPVKAYDEGADAPQAAALLCPLTDFVFERHASFERLAPLGIVYDAAFAGFIRGAYVVHHRLWPHPHVSPALADLAGYPPTLIVSGTADPMIDDNTAFAARLRAAGCPRVEHFVRERMPHGYYFFPGLLAEGDQAFAAVADFLRAELDAPGTPAGA